MRYDNSSLPTFFSPLPWYGKRRCETQQIISTSSHSPTTMKLTNDAEVAVYTVSGASTARPLPDWLIRQRKKSLKKDPEFAHRVELLQDFEFEEASNAIRVSQDGNWIMSTGTYKPQFHVHSLPQLSLSFSRHTESLNVTVQFLSSDYSKSIHLQTDRRLELHTPMGMHYALRLPRYGRDLQYNRSAA